MLTHVSPPVRGKSWVFQLTALCIILGALLALSLKTQRQAASEGIPNRLPSLRSAFRITRQENEKLQKELGEYKTLYEKLAREKAEGLRGASDLKSILAQSKLMAGLVAVRGPGVIVTLHDSPQRNPAETDPEVIEAYLVHDAQIRDIVNELFSVGAEAVAVNGQRLVSTSSIRCVGAAVLVNSVHIAPPYVIKAIGKPDVLQKALELPGGIADDLYNLDMIEVRKISDMVVPAYTGTSRFGVARPMEKAD